METQRKRWTEIGCYMKIQWKEFETIKEELHGKEGFWIVEKSGGVESKITLCWRGFHTLSYEMVK